MTTTPQIPALPGMTPLGLAPTVTFQMRCGTRVTGKIVGDYGHAYLIKVETVNRKNLRGKTTLFPKHDLGPIR
jgi:hypothetical protein